MIERTDRHGVILDTPSEIALAQRAVYNLPTTAGDSAFYIRDGHFAIPEPAYDGLHLNAQETEIVIAGLCYVIDGQIKLRDELGLAADTKPNGHWPIYTKRSLREAKREQLARLDRHQAVVTQRMAHLLNVLHGVVVSYEDSKRTLDGERRVAQLRAVNQ